jgi:hypothetical protein
VAATVTVLAATAAAIPPLFLPPVVLPAAAAVAAAPVFVRHAKPCTLHATSSTERVGGSAGDFANQAPDTAAPTNLLQGASIEAPSVMNTVSAAAT